MQKLIASNIINHYPEAGMIINQLTENTADFGLLEQSSIYFGFPKFVGYEEEDLEPDLLILSPMHGICVIRFSQNKLTSSDVEEIADEIYSLIFSKLNESKKLRSKRGQIAIPLEAYVFCDENILNSYHINSIEGVDEKLKEQILDLPIGEELINETKSIIEGTKALSAQNTRSRRINDTTSKAFIVSQLENEIKNFDYKQLQSAITILDGPQRIRGLAGSGKTVVLAMKAAQIHINEPDRVILFTFYTKSLYQQIKNLITRFYRHYKKVDPNWEKIHIKHAWGGHGIDGVYYSSCIENGINTMTFPQAKKFSNNPFNYACETALNTGRIREKYDYVLIDEAQDLPTYFFRLIFQITKYNFNIGDEKNIIWGYDDLQNIFNVKTKTPQALFGSDSENLDFIDLDRASSKIPHYLNNDIVLRKCYRNPRSVLLVAHSLGFGFYNNEGNLPVQILENKEHWEDFGYNVLSGDIVDNSIVEIERPIENSPLSIGKYTDEKELISYYKAENIDEEIKWITKEIEKCINEEFLNAEDILVISLDDLNAKTYFNMLTDYLLEKSIQVNNLLSNPYTKTDFINNDHITLSTVHRAKGNEAPVVFVLGIDAVYKERKTRRGRNKIFTAFTRTKCCLKVSGILSGAQYFFDEIDKTLQSYPNLKFTQPSQADVETLQRDLNDKSKKIKDLRKEFYKQLKEEGLSEDEIKEELELGNKI